MGMTSKSTGKPEDKKSLGRPRRRKMKIHLDQGLRVCSELIWLTMWSSGWQLWTYGSKLSGSI